MIQPRSSVKSGRASLIGGIAVAIASFILWAAIAHQSGHDTIPVLALGLCVSAGVGVWIRLADL